MSLRRGRLVVALVASVSLAAVAAACSGGDASTGGADAAPPPEPFVDASRVETSRTDASSAACELSGEAEEHACLHATAGPFADLASGQTATDAHVVFEVPVVDGAFEVAFRPARPGTWAFFLSPAEMTFDMRLRGTTMEVRRLGNPSCRALGAAYVVALAAGETVWLLGATTAQRARLLVERVDELDLVGDACPRPLPRSDAGPTPDRQDGGTMSGDAGACRSAGPCTRDEECCDYCHDKDHCH